jgi:hypothetical protein
MNRIHAAVLLFLSSLLSAPLLAQTTIGGNPCTSRSVMGPYALSITGRQVTASGAFTNVFQANGTASFDGLSAVTVSLTTDTNQAVATPLNWSGAYSVQANCAGVITITSGGNATLNLALYDNGIDFLITGNDATYSYSGNGNTQPAGCSLSLFSGVYTLNANGFTLSGTSVNGSTSVVGLLEFDGQGHVTVNASFSPSNSNASALTGSYSVSSNCLGSATLTDSKGASYVMSLSAEDLIPAASPLYTSNIYVGLAQNSKFIVTGDAHAIYGQPTSTATAAVRSPAPRGGRT